MAEPVVSNIDPGIPGSPIDFQLQTFFPYLVRLFYRSVSSSIEDIYQSTYGLTVSEWRTIVVLGPRQALSAGDIVAQSSMDKVNVSRAVGRLREAGLLKRDIDGDDRRKAVLRLTPEGVEVFNALVPKVLAMQEHLFDGLSSDERATLLELMSKVRGNADRIRAE